MENHHELIHTNLSLLREVGYKIDFQQGMFRDSKLLGFEKVGRALLMVLDPVECEKTIRWPLLNDRIHKSEFRKSFTNFIKMINKKHPGANIPEITASSLQCPGGPNFVNFVYRLSSFALETELRRMLNAKETAELLPKFKNNKQSSKDQAVKLNIVTGARYDAEACLRQYNDYQMSALPLLQELNDYSNRLCVRTKSVAARLKLEVSNLNVDDEMKHRLLDSTDSQVMTDCSSTINNKLLELESTCNKLKQYEELSTQCCQLLKTFVAGSGRSICVDGSKLGVTSALTTLAGCPVYNSNGELKLKALFSAGMAAARKAAPTVPSDTSPLLPRAQDLLTDFRSLQIKANKTASSLNKLCYESKETINKLRPIMYARVNEEQVPDYFKYFKNPPANQFITPSAISKEVSPFKKELLLRFSSQLKMRRKTHRVVGSVKQKRAPPHPMLTPLFLRPKTPATSIVFRNTNSTVSRYLTSSKKPRKPLSLHNFLTPDVSCRKSLYGKLPTGPKENLFKPSSVQDLTKFSPEEFSPLKDFSPISESSEELFNNIEIPITPSIKVSHSSSQTPLAKRKSFNELVNRYYKIRNKMDTTQNSPDNIK